jgi:hypothetical protein
MRQHCLERVVCIVPAWTYLVGADEIHEHVLVHQRAAQLLRGNRPRHRLDRLSA